MGITSFLKSGGKLWKNNFRFVFRQLSTNIHKNILPSKTYTLHKLKVKNIHIYFSEADKILTLNYSISTKLFPNHTKQAGRTAPSKEI